MAEWWQYDDNDDDGDTQPTSLVIDHHADLPGNQFRLNNGTVISIALSEMESILACDEATLREIAKRQISCGIAKEGRQENVNGVTYQLVYEMGWIWREVDTVGGKPQQLSMWEG